MGSDRDNLRSERDRFVAFAFSAAELLLEVDEQLRITYAAGANSQLTGHEAGDLVGTTLIELFTPSDRKLVCHALEQLGPAGRLDPISVRLGARGRQAVMGACRLPSAPQRIYLSLAKARARAVIPQPNAVRDKLSGTWDRERFIDVAAEIVHQSSLEEREDRLTVLHLQGLDGLRARAGKEAVDDLLGETGAYLRSQSIGGDAVGRLADDRYGILHDASLSPETVVRVVGEMSRDADPGGLGLSLVKGCMNLASDGISAEDIGRILSYALQNFGDHDVGRLDRLTMSDAFDSLVQQTASRLASLKQTVAQQDFHIAFQPIVVLSDLAIHHYEVLSRFPDTMRPGETVQFAEQVGLIEELDLTVCQFAISVIQEREARGDNLELAINISGRSFGSSIFVRLLDELLAKLNRNRHRLLIEVTETARLENLDEARNVLQDLRDKGHVICLDDFGSGASSLQYLQSLPVDFIKIDGSYVRSFLDNEQDEVIIRSMISMSRALNVRTIAEMVETEAQAAGLKRLGVDLGQGWLFGKPQYQVPTTSIVSRRAAVVR